MRKITTLLAAAALAVSANAAGLVPSYMNYVDGATLDFGFGYPNIYMTFEDNVSVVAGSKAVFSNADGTWSKEVAIELSDTSDNEAIAYLSDAGTPPANGAYTLSIPAGVITDGTLSNDAMLLNYTVSGLIVPSSNPDKPVTATTLQFTDGTNVYNLLEPGCKVPNLNSNTYLEAVLDGPDQMCGAQVEIKQGEMLIQSLFIAKNAEGVYKTYMMAFYDYDFLAGTEYSVTITGRNASSMWASNFETYAPLTVNFEGATAAYTYADAELTLYEPTTDWERNPSITDANTPIRLTYSAAIASCKVTMYDPTAGWTVTFDAVPSSDNTVWTVDADKTAEYWEKAMSSVYIDVIAADANGQRVKGNHGKNETSYYQWSVPCYLGCPEVAVQPVSGATVPELEWIVFGAPADLPVVALAYGWEGYPVLMDATGREVASIPDTNFERLDADMQPVTDYYTTVVYLKGTLSTKVTEAGTYTLLVPSGTMSYELEGGKYTRNKTCQFTYTVDPNVAAVEGVGAENVSVSATAGGILVSGVVANVKVYSLDGSLAADVDGEGEIAVAVPAGLYVVVVDGNALKIRK